MIWGSAARPLVFASTTSFLATPLGAPGLVPAKSSGLHVTVDPSGATVAVPPAGAIGVAVGNVMPSTAGMVGLAPDTGSTLVLVTLTVAGDVSAGFTQPLDDTNW